MNAFTVALTTLLILASAPAVAQSAGSGAPRRQIYDELRYLEHHGYDPRSYYWQESLAQAQARIDKEHSGERRDLAALAGTQQ